MTPGTENCVFFSKKFRRACMWLKTQTQSSLDMELQICRTEDKCELVSTVIEHRWQEEQTHIVIPCLVAIILQLALHFQLVTGIARGSIQCTQQIAKLILTTCVCSFPEPDVITTYLQETQPSLLMSHTKLVKEWSHRINFWSIL
jgi:hypothetical protein